MREYCLFSYIFSRLLEALAGAIRQEEEIKEILTRKENNLSYSYLLMIRKIHRIPTEKF